MYNKGFFFILNWVRFQTLSGSLIPKYWSSTPSPGGGGGGGVGAETDTILKTKNPPGGGETLEQER